MQCSTTIVFVYYALIDIKCMGFIHCIYDAFNQSIMRQLMAKHGIASFHNRLPSSVWSIIVYMSATLITHSMCSIIEWLACSYIFILLYIIIHFPFLLFNVHVRFFTFFHCLPRIGNLFPTSTMRSFMCMRVVLNIFC